MGDRLGTKQRHQLNIAQKAQMANLKNRYEMPHSVAIRVVTGELSLVDAIKYMQRRERVAALVGQKKINKEEASRILSGVSTLDEVAFHRRVVMYKRKPEYMASVLNGLEGTQHFFALVSGGRAQGTVKKIEKYTFVVEGADGELEFDKHDVKVVFPVSDKKKLMKRGIQWGAPDRRVEEGFLGKFANRRDIKARHLLRALEAETVVTWETIEGDRVRGIVQEFNRFEVVMKTTRGPIVYLMRHAVGAMEE